MAGKIILIVAVSSNDVIGNNNKLLWNLPEDMKHFRQKTTGNVVVMGRKTYESIGRALPKRKNIVVSKNHINDLSVEVIDDFDKAIVAARIAAPLTENGDVYIIGGATIYNQAMEVGIVDEISLTYINKEYEGDAAVTPLINATDWDMASLKSFPAQGEEPNFTIFHFVKRKTPRIVNKVTK